METVNNKKRKLIINKYKFNLLLLQPNQLFNLIHFI